jgi:hypothetical protein
MKKLFTLLTFAFCISNVLIAQVPPNAFNYSAVARNAAGAPIANTTIGIQITILKTSPTGASQYSENHFVNTDAFGLFNLTVGAGAVQSGSMAAINWSNDNYYLKVGMDANGSTNFLSMGTTQLLSVPYALHAKTAESIVGGTTPNVYIQAGSNVTITGTGTQANPYIINAAATGTTVGTVSLFLPTITTNAVIGITSNSATFGGAISNANGNQIMERGIVYSTSSNPTLGSNRIMIGNGIGNYDTTTSMNYNYAHFLQPSTQYFIRAYAITENNISVYGNEVNFTTSALIPPSIITDAATNITSYGASFTGTITNANGNQIMERGIVYSTSPNPTIITNKIVVGSGVGSFSCIAGYYPNILYADTTYYARAYAITDNNIPAYGNEVTFTTLYDVRDSLVGYWNVIENSTITGGQSSFVVNITKSTTNANEILLNNFSGLSVSVIASVSNNNITIPYQQIGTIGFTQGSGTKTSPTTITLSYTNTIGATAADNCTAIYTKQ